MIMAAVFDGDESVTGDKGVTVGSTFNKEGDCLCLVERLSGTVTEDVYVGLATSLDLVTKGNEVC